MLQAIPVLSPKGSESAAPQREEWRSVEGEEQNRKVLQSSDASFGERGQGCALWLLSMARVRGAWAWHERVSHRVSHLLWGQPWLQP